MTDTSAFDKPESQSAAIWRQFRQHKGAVFGLCVLGFLVVFVLIGPLFWQAPELTTTQQILNKNKPPSWAHPMGTDQIGPVTAIALMLQSLGGPVVLAIIQAVITSRTLYLGGTTGPVNRMTPDQLHALDQGYSYGMLWVAGVAVIVGAVALFIGYTASQVAHAQEVKEALDAGDI
jgi:ABC-type antimicrobial peptide transport system permease subunit